MTMPVLTWKSISIFSGLEFRLSSDRFESNRFAFPVGLFTDPDFNVSRDGEGWMVTGRVYNGDGFFCRIGNDGRIFVDRHSLCVDCGSNFSRVMGVGGPVISAGLCRHRFLCDIILPVSG